MDIDTHNLHKVAKNIDNKNYRYDNITDINILIAQSVLSVVNNMVNNYLDKWRRILFPYAYGYADGMLTLLTNNFTGYKCPCHKMKKVKFINGIVMAQCVCNKIYWVANPNLNN